MNSSLQYHHENVKGISSTLPRPVTDERRYRYSLDIISDGSAFTGDGTLIFSILRGSAASVVNKNTSCPTSCESSTTTGNCDEEEVIIRRYSFGYCENMGRLVQDQKQKISKITAVFLPKTNVSAAAGIPSLLLALSDTGAAEQITMVGPPPLKRYINFITHMFLNKRLYPKVNLCEIPTTQSQREELTETNATKKRSYNGETKKRTEDSTNHPIHEPSTWWSVYHDEYVQVYARIYHGATTVVASSEKGKRGNMDHNLVCAAYIISVLSSDGRNAFSFSIAPKHVQLSPLPELIDVSSSRSKPFKFSIQWTDFIPVDATKTFNSTTRSTATSLAQFTYEVCKNHDTSQDDDEMESEMKWDAGILRSSTIQGKMLHDLLPSVFPYTRAISVMEKEMEKQPHQPPNSRLLTRRKGSDLFWNGKDILRLQTGDSLRFQRLDSLMTQPTIVHFPYRQSIAWRTSNLTSSAAIAASASFLRSISGIDCPPIDENEIYLSDGDSYDLPVNSHTEKATSIYPHLLFLGTGCAAPSAIRGSSGYAIFLPFCQQTAGLNTKNNNTLALFALLDCGEGCLTSLAQYIPQSLSLQQSLLSLKLIWISHSHLDHYGGLVTVLKAIDDASRPTGENARHCSEKPIIIAPQKVLQYLDECLGCVNGVLRIEDKTSPAMMRRLFHGTTHQEFQLSSTSSGEETVREKLFGFRLRHCTELQLWQPVADLRNIPVEHCPHSYSLIIDLQYPDAESHGRRIKTFCLCYSGDCRPSTNLISACQQHCQRPDLVIHEATFDDNMKQEARSKRHCTVSEALEVVSKMDASACILSHFSQRYPHTSNQSKQHTPKTVSSPAFLCSAVDGLFLPLSERVFLSLNLLDSAITTFLDPTV